MRHKIDDETALRPKFLDAANRLADGGRMMAVIVHEEDAPRLA
jgi:hypothetical protein